MFYSVQHPHIAGGRHIAASGFFLVQPENGDGDSRLPLDVLLDNSNKITAAFVRQGWLILLITSIRIE